MDTNVNALVIFKSSLQTYHWAHCFINKVSLVHAQVEADIVTGDVSVPLREVVVENPVSLANNARVNNPVQPLSVNLDNLIQDIDLGIDEMWREGREPMTSCCMFVGSNVEIPDYCTCDYVDDEVTSEFLSDSDIFILCCGEYRSLGEKCICANWSDMIGYKYLIPIHLWWLDMIVCGNSQCCISMTCSSTYLLDLMNTYAYDIDWH